MVAGVICASLLALALAATAAASPPTITISAPATGSVNTPLPSFTGTSEDAFDPITLGIYAGASATPGEPTVQAPLVLLSPGGSWEANAETSLADGQYTALAQQTNENSETGYASVTFTVDTAPVVSLEGVPSYTTDSTPQLGGSAGARPGDLSVTVTIYEGSSAGGREVAVGSVPVSDAAWSYVTPELRDGTYTAQAVQEDEAGNRGVSSPATFTVDTPPPPVTVTAPWSGAVVDQAWPTFSGNAGSASGDLPAVTVRIYAGTATSGAPAQTLSVTAADGRWKSAADDLPLPNGLYTVLAEQADVAGNIGTSSPVTFTIATRSPTVTLQTFQLFSRAGSPVTDATPAFSGAAGSEPEDSGSVTLEIYSGDSGESGGRAPVRTLSAEVNGSTWSTGPVAPLPDGTYTAQAQQPQQHSEANRTGYSSQSIFTVDADPPQVTLSSPAQGSSTNGSSEAVAGGAGTAEGDLPSIDVELFPGAAISGQAPLEAITVQATGASWSAAFGGLSPGTYTARAEQRDDVGNSGYSAPVTFTVTPAATTGTAAGASGGSPAAPAVPVASFQWFPTAPHVGETVSLVSSSSDGGGSISGFAWSLGPTAPLAPGGHVLTTSFAAPGAHLVRLRVTDANGLSGEAAETIAVTPAAIALMQPFPVVRIAGSVRSSKVKINLFTVQAPVGATLRVSCHGHGCPPRPQSFTVTARSARNEATALVSFTRFERSLGAGAVLEIRISKAGQIGKYTSFTIRRGRLPARLDTCLSPSGVKPMACPS